MQSTDPSVVVHSGGLGGEMGEESFGVKKNASRTKGFVVDDTTLSLHSLWLNKKLNAISVAQQIYTMYG